ncbi:MAG: nickel pincer cofactor biosynthesis protein LarC [Candidatus Contubernalis sp.]|nr:nickel pincer cofactor biosynthesis protein LarC [Candidatus Contubernalis sp.]
MEKNNKNEHNKIIYFHCFSGVSGDMVLGALLDTGLTSIAYLKEELKKVPLKGYSLEQETVLRGGLSGTRFKVKEEGQAQPLRTLQDLLKLVEESQLSEIIKEKGLAVFQNLARAEARVHGTTPEQVHFHEVGAVDTVVDVLGALILMEKIGISQIYSSPLHVGSGFVRCNHGLLPLPAPATVELLKGVPVYSRGVKGELTTPTGAALLTTLASGFGPLPAGKMLAVGYGAGSRELEHPNLLRVLLLEEEIKAGQPENLQQPGTEDLGSLKKEEILSVETNIDDMNPEIFSFLLEKLFEAGAWDITLTPIYMKKNRPATRLSVLCPPELFPRVSQIIFTETSSLGLRVFRGEKYSLPRDIREVTTPYGPIRVKVGFLEGEAVTISPEYEDCARAARSQGVPLEQVYRAAQKKGSEL